MEVLIKIRWNFLGIFCLFCSSLMFFSCDNQHNWNENMTDYGPSFSSIEEAIAFEKYLAVHNDSIGTYELYLNEINNEWIDTSGIKQLKNIRSLIIYYAKFESIPAAIIRLKKLRNLELQDCIVFESTKGIEKISTLEKLKFYGTSITKISDEMIALKNLKEFEWRKNQTPFGLDSSLFFLTNSYLERVDFSENMFTEIPIGLKGMKYVRNIYLNNNKITKIPKELVNFERGETYYEYSNMVEINLIENPISEADKEWAKKLIQNSNIYYYFGFED